MRGVFKSLMYSPYFTAQAVCSSASTTMVCAALKATSAAPLVLLASSRPAGPYTARRVPVAPSDPAAAPAPTLCLAPLREPPEALVVLVVWAVLLVWAERVA